MRMKWPVAGVEALFVSVPSPRGINFFFQDFYKVVQMRFYLNKHLRLVLCRNKLCPIDCSVLLTISKLGFLQGRTDRWTGEKKVKTQCAVKWNVRLQISAFIPPFPPFQQSN